MELPIVEEIEFKNNPPTIKDVLLMMIVKEESKTGEITGKGLMALVELISSRSDIPAEVWYDQVLDGKFIEKVVHKMSQAMNVGVEISEITRDL